MSETLNRFIIGNFEPDVTFLSTVNINNIRLRLSKRPKLNRYDKFKLNFYTKVQRGYLRLLQKNKKKYILIDSNKYSIRDVKKKIIKRLNNFI